MASDDPLLQPFRLKHLVFKNRVMSTSHAPAYVEDGVPKERYQLYHEEKAKGGIALSMFGGSSNIAPDSPSVFGQIYLGGDDVIPYFQQFAERLHRHGTAIMCQLTHMGRRTTWNMGHWLPTIAPSRVRETAHRSFPKEMEEEDIARVVKAFGEAARRCRDGGLDGCEILAHGHLVDQFWTPSVNKRTDRYGGSLANRMRFSLAVLEEIRRRVGDDFIVGMRMAASEGFEGGLGRDDCLEIAKTHEASGLIDFLNVNVGRIDSDAALAQMMPGMAAPLAPYLDIVARFKRELGLPIFHACRVNDVATARHAVAEDMVDMIGMTRAHMADPHIVRKIEAGREAEIRPCVGAGYCIDRIYEGGEALCLHNAATGREATMPHAVAATTGARKKIVVVGGGPAGLEAARVSAERGHSVVLFEASGRLGGQVLLAGKAAWRRDLLAIVDWFESEIARLGVDVRFATLAERAEVEGEAPDIVVLATGGVPDLACVDGGELCASVWDILGGTAQVAESVLLFDDNGQHPGPACAEYVSDRGAELELVTPDRMAAAEMGALNYPIYLANLYRKGVRMTPDRRLVSVTRHDNRLRAVLKNEYTGEAEERVIDQVIVEHGTIPADALYHDLKPRSINAGTLDHDALIENRPQDLTVNPRAAYRLYRVGDAVASRNIHAAVYDSLRICKDF